ncbi:MAG: hypothetical protein R3236_04770 [Phycisphaeraceae bacterium]|nr:hypothetical protein [Phycisphaeraceae bacterium]
METDRTPAAHQQLQRLRGWRNRPSRDLTLGFLNDHFQKKIQKPCQQLARIREPFCRHVPEPLLNSCTLGGLVRGVLTVHVPDSATAYALDRHLRGGGERRIRADCMAPLRRIRVRVVRPT